MSDDDGYLVVDVSIDEDGFEGECYGTMPPLAESSCRYLLNHMDAAHMEERFGPSSEPDKDVVLPHTIVSRE